MKTLTVPFFISHHGCPHRCVFCDQEKIAGAAARLPSAREILSKVELFAQGARGRALEVAFFGGSFTALPLQEQRALLEPLQALLSAGTVSGIRLSTRPDAVTAETVSFLREMGVGTVELGVQSMEDEVLHRAGRGHTSADVESAARAVTDGGLCLGIQLMPGLPGDTRERALESLRRCLALNPSFLRIYPVVVLKGTPLAALHAAGEYQPLTVEEAVAVCKEMLLCARRHHVPVVRMGLQPTDDLEAPGVVVAGAYHPAFGQLVESELFFDLICLLVEPLPREASVALLVPRGRLSDVLGQKRGNVARLAGRFAISVESVREDPLLSRDALVLCWEGGIRKAELSDLFTQ